jgi:hypothetical protein
MRFSVIVTTTVAGMWLFVLSCGARQVEVVTDAELANELRGMQSKQGITIGWTTATTAEYLDWTDEMRKRKIPIEAVTLSKPGKTGSPSPATQEVPADATTIELSPDGSSVVYRARDGNIYLAGRHLEKPTLLVSGTDMRTSPSWSPDGQFLLFVEKQPNQTLSETLSCGGEMDLVEVTRVKDQRKATAFSTCEGFPYWAVGWIRVPK